MRAAPPRSGGEGERTLRFALGASFPNESFRPEYEIDDGREARDDGEGPEDAVGAEEAELDVAGAQGDERGEEDAAGARVGRGARVGDHEKREEQQRAVLEAVQRDGHRD